MLVRDIFSQLQLSLAPAFPASKMLRPPLNLTSNIVRPPLSVLNTICVKTEYILGVGENLLRFSVFSSFSISRFEVETVHNIGFVRFIWECKEWSQNKIFLSNFHLQILLAPLSLASKMPYPPRQCGPYIS